MQTDFLSAPPALTDLQRRCLDPIKPQLVGNSCWLRLSFSLKAHHVALTVLFERVGFQRFEQSSPLLKFSQGSKVTDELVTGEAGARQQLCHGNRRNNGNKAWTCQLGKPEHTLFLLYHYRAVDTPAGESAVQSAAKTTKTITHLVERYWAMLESK